MAVSNLKYCLQFIYFKAIYNIVTVLTNDITDLPASKVKLAVSKITQIVNYLALFTTSMLLMFYSSIQTCTMANDSISVINIQSTYMSYPSLLDTCHTV